MNDEKEKSGGKPVWVKDDTVADLESFKTHPRETYDDVIKKLISFKRDKSVGYSKVAPNAQPQ